MSFSQYGRYANEVESEQRRYKNRLDSLQSSRQNIKSRLDQANRRYSEERQRLQRELQSELSKRDRYWSQQLASKQQKLKEKEAAKEKEMDAKIEKVRQKMKKLRIRRKKERRAREQAELAEAQRQEEVSISSTLPHQYKPSLSTGIYGSYMVKKLRIQRQEEVLPHQYQPSLSTGIYGSYMLKKFPENSLQKLPEKAVHGHHHQHDDDEKKEQEEETDVLYQQMYAEHKKVDEESKYIFKPECNWSGCCNQPEVDPKLLKGDMYICKEHRAKMVKQFKQSGIKGEMVDDVLDKFGSMSDAELLQHGEQVEASDYFLKSYTAAHLRRVQIAKKLSTLKQIRTSSEYWRLKLEYKRLQKCCDFLVMIRRISNPSWCIFTRLLRWLFPDWYEREEEERRAREEESRRREEEERREKEHREEEHIEEEQTEKERRRRREKEQREKVRKQTERRQESKKKEKQSEKEIDASFKLCEILPKMLLDPKKMKNKCIQKRKKTYKDTETDNNRTLKKVESAIKANQNKRINHKKKKNGHDLAIDQKQKILNALSKNKEQEQGEKIKSTEDEFQLFHDDIWEEKEVLFNDALFNKEIDLFEVAKSYAPAISAMDPKILKFETKLAAEPKALSELKLIESRMTRLENQERRRPKPVKTELENKTEDIDADLKRIERELQRWNNDKKVQLNMIKKLGEDEVKRLKKKAEDDLKRRKDEGEAIIKTIDQEKERVIGGLKTEEKNIERQLDHHQTTGKTQLEQFKIDKRESERKQRQYEREQEEAERERARALKEAERERRRIERERERQRAEAARRALARAREEAERERKRKEREAEQERDDRDFERAVTRAKQLVSGTSAGRVALYVVWDSRKGLQNKGTMYDQDVDQTYEKYGNFWIAKYDGNRPKNRDKWNKIEFTTSGRYWSQARYNKQQSYVFNKYDNDTRFVYWL